MHGLVHRSTLFVTLAGSTDDFLPNAIVIVIDSPCPRSTEATIDAAAEELGVPYLGNTICGNDVGALCCDDDVWALLR